MKGAVDRYAIDERTRGEARPPSLRTRDYASRERALVRRADQQEAASQHAHVRPRALNADIHTWIETWNDDPRPYVWTKTADQIVDSIATYCERVNRSRH